MTQQYPTEKQVENAFELQHNREFRSDPRKASIAADYTRAEIASMPIERYLEWVDEMRA